VARHFTRYATENSLGEQHAALTRRIEGHVDYFGVNGDIRPLRKLVHEAERLWHLWLCHWSQNRCLTWQRFGDLLQVFPLPRPRIRVQTRVMAP
jgi:hypothetical protein